MKLKMFVAHVFSKEYMDDFRREIKEVSEKLYIIPIYADHKLTDEQILKGKICKQIEDADFALFEISEPEKPNVFIELGFALGINKFSVLVMKTGRTAPSDLQGIDRIEYETYTDLNQKLLKHLEKVMTVLSNKDKLHITLNEVKSLLKNYKEKHEGLLMVAEKFSNNIHHASRKTIELVSILNSPESNIRKNDEIDKYLLYLDKTFKDPVFINKNLKIGKELGLSYKVVRRYLNSEKKDLNKSNIDE